MTVTVKVHVNGRYEATVTNQTTGETVVVGPQEEKQVYFRHGEPNTVLIEERYLGEETKSAPEADAVDEQTDPEA